MIHKDKNFGADQVIPTRTLVIGTNVIANQADVKAYEHLPAFPFEIVSVASYCLTKVGAVTFDVKVGGVSVLSAPLATAAGARQVGALVAAALRRGSAAAAISVHYTSDATGVLTNGHVTVVIRPTGLRGGQASL
jgi:hypothetical protein